MLELLLVKSRKHRYPEKEGKNGIKYKNDQKPQQGCLGPVFFGRMGVVAESPNEKHNDVEQGDKCDEYGNHPVLNGQRLVLPAGLI
jgi:hypothetical protein